MRHFQAGKDYSVKIIKTKMLEDMKYGSSEVGTECATIIAAIVEKKILHCKETRKKKFCMDNSLKCLQTTWTTDETVYTYYTVRKTRL